MRLSVIIPCYNVADTLQVCVQSVLVQLPRESEVLLVDDGSTDTTGLLAEQIAAEHVAVRVFIFERRLTEFGKCFIDIVVATGFSKV